MVVLTPGKPNANCKYLNQHKVKNNVNIVKGKFETFEQNLMILIRSLGMLAIEYIFKRFRRVYNCAKFHKGEKWVLINVSKKGTGG